MRRTSTFQWVLSTVAQYELYAHAGIEGDDYGLVLGEVELQRWGKVRFRVDMNAVVRSLPIELGVEVETIFRHALISNFYVGS